MKPANNVKPRRMSAQLELERPTKSQDRPNEMECGSDLAELVADNHPPVLTVQQKNFTLNAFCWMQYK